MEIARFEFKPEAAEDFAWNDGQTIVEMQFLNILELIQFVEEVKETLIDCTVISEGKTISLKQFSK